MKYALLLGSCFLLTACVTTQWPWADSKSADKAYQPCSSATCSEQDARKALAAASHYCVRIMEYNANSRAMLGGSRVALSSIGALSGGVIAQVAGGTASKAWAGISGVTNGMQSKMDEAFAGALYLQRRKAVATAAGLGMEKVMKAERTPEKRVEAAMQMALACAAAAAEADANSLNAINNAAPTTPPPNQNAGAN